MDLSEILNKNILKIKGLDIADRTPHLDLKPYFLEFDMRDVELKGWLSNNAHRVEYVKS